MNIIWTESAKKSFKKYKINLLHKIEQKIAIIMETTPTNEPSWHGTYRILVDKYKVYYSFSEDRRICYIEAFRHHISNGKKVLSTKLIILRFSLVTGNCTTYSEIH